MDVAALCCVQSGVAAGIAAGGAELSGRKPAGKRFYIKFASREKNIFFRGKKLPAVN